MAIREMFEESQLTATAQKILAIINAEPSKKFTRSDLATAFNKNRLNPHEVNVLQDLAQRDLIDAEHVLIGGQKVWQYIARPQ